MGRRKARTQGVEQPSRDVAAAVRVIQALDLAIAGYDWRTIAERVGYAGPGPAYTAVQRELQRRIAPKVDELRQMHYQRAQRFRQVYVPKALAGDGWSFDRMLRLDEREAALFGLDAPKTEAASVAPIFVEIPMPLDGLIQRGPHAGLLESAPDGASSSSSDN